MFRRWWPLPPFLGCVLAGVLLGLGGYTFWYAEGASYFSSNPQACANCHVMREHLDSWQRASHHAAAPGIDCPLPPPPLPKSLAKPENGFWHSLRFTLQDYSEPIRIGARNARILQQNCIACHRELVAEVVGHGSAADPSNNCVRCHA